MEITHGLGFVSHDSILLTHGAPTRRAYLLLHGLTASPRQFELIGRMLYERGANVVIPRLPRHGLANRLTDELVGLTSHELREFAIASAREAAGLGDDVRVVGFSVGGLLAAWLAQHVAIDRATCVAPFLGVAWLPRRMTGRAAQLALALPNRFLWWNPLLRERLQPEHGYPRFPTHAIARAAQLGADVIASAEREPPRARDVQIVLNASEAAVNNRAARRLGAAWARSRPDAIVVHQLRGLPPSHDIIEPMRDASVARDVARTLVDLADR